MERRDKLDTWAFAILPFGIMEKAGVRERRCDGWVTGRGDVSGGAEAEDR